MKFANEMPNGCLDQVKSCEKTNRTSLTDHAICTQATNMCRDNVGKYIPTLEPHVAQPDKT